MSWIDWFNWDITPIFIALATGIIGMIGGYIQYNHYTFMLSSLAVISCFGYLFSEYSLEVKDDE